MLTPTTQHQYHVRKFTNNIYAHNIYTHQQHHHSNSTTSYNSHNLSKGENTPHHDKHHIQHSSIIHTSLFIHNKLFIKDFQGNRTQRLYTTKFVSYLITLKQLKQLNQKPSKQLNCLNYVYTLFTYECRCAYKCVSSAQ